MPNHHLDGAFAKVVNFSEDDEGTILTVFLLEERGHSYPIGSEVDIAPYEFKKDV